MFIFLLWLILIFLMINTVISKMKATARWVGPVTIVLSAAVAIVNCPLNANSADWL